MNVCQRFLSADEEFEVRFRKLFSIWHSLKEKRILSGSMKILNLCSRDVQTLNNSGRLIMMDAEASKKTVKFKFSSKPKKIETK